MDREFVSRALACALLLLCGSSPASSSTVWSVNLTGEPIGAQGCPTFCSLRDAITQSASGDTIRFAASIDGQSITLTQYSNALSGTEFGPSAFFITGNKTLTIDGITGLTLGVTIARDVAADKFRLFDVDSGSSLTLTGVTLANGFASGFSSVGGGGSLGAGGAIFNAGTLALQRCTLRNNTAMGGTSTPGQQLISPGGAGVGQASQYANGGGPNGGVSGGTLGSPTGGGFGGGGAAGKDAMYVSATNGLSGGFGGGGGGGGATVAAVGTTGGNGGFGGGAGWGGLAQQQTGPSGVDGYGALASIGASMGGAIFNNAGIATIENSTLTANGALSAGASALGGAIFNYNGSLTLNFVTMAGNSVDLAYGNGVALFSLGDSLASCQSGGNPCWAGGHILTMNSSIAAYNVFVPDVYDVVVTAINGGLNWSFGADNLIMSNSGYSGTIASSADPKLDALAYNGGTTQTMLPTAASPVVDAIACGPATVDQRGVARPQLSACDIGAVERKLQENEIFGDGFELIIIL